MFGAPAPTSAAPARVTLPSLFPCRRTPARLCLACATTSCRPCVPCRRTPAQPWLPSRLSYQTSSRGQRRPTSSSTFLVGMRAANKTTSPSWSYLLPSWPSHSNSAGNSGVATNSRDSVHSTRGSRISSKKLREIVELRHTARGYDAASSSRANDVLREYEMLRQAELRKLNDALNLKTSETAMEEITAMKTVEPRGTCGWRSPSLDALAQGSTRPLRSTMFSVLNLAKSRLLARLRSSSPRQPSK